MFMILVYVFAVIGVVETIYLAGAAYCIDKHVKELESKYDDFELKSWTPFMASYNYTIPDKNEE